MIGVTSASLASFGRRPYGRRAAAARGSLATGRSRVGRACIAPLPDCQAAKAAGLPGDVLAHAYCNRSPGMHAWHAARRLAANPGVRAVEAADEDEIRARLARDPWASAGLLRIGTIEPYGRGRHPWHPAR